MKNSANNLMTIKNENRTLILRTIRKKPVSRAEISKLTGLSKSSVTGIVNELINEGQLIETGTETATLGRRPILLDIIPTYRYAIGFEIHRKSISVIVTDLKSHVIDRAKSPLSDFESPNSIIEYAISTACELLKVNNISSEQVIGVGVSCPGPLDIGKGVILSPPDLEILHNTEIVHIIEERTGWKVSLENNPVLLALFEKNFDCEIENRNVLSVIVSNGIGSAILTKGHVYRGFGGFSGEFGHISIDPHGERCTCGNIGCLEHYTSLEALKQKFGFDEFQDVVDGALAGNETSMVILDYIAQNFGVALVTAINLFDIDQIIIHGDFSYKPELLSEKIMTYIQDHSMIAASHEIKISFKELGLRKDISSSTIAILDEYFN